jgi:predicted acetyltransferase
MDVELRAMTHDLVGGYQRADARAFGERLEREPDDPWTSYELERAVGAFDGDEVVGTGRNYSLELTMPGGGVLPVAGVSWIGVVPTHRRRGIMQSVMDWLLLDACAREEPALVLTASEATIYGRFGYGVATRVLGVELDRHRVSWRAPAPGRVRLVEPDEAVKIAPPVFERMRGTRPGVISRPDVWWENEWWDTRATAPRFDVVFDGDSGPEGFALYQVAGDWSEGETYKTLGVRDLVAATPEAAIGLWQYLCGVDLIRKITAWNMPIDTELPWLLTDPRAMRVTSRRDFLWLRPVDVPVLLASRRYPVDGRLVLEVLDDGPAAGRYELDGGSDGATCRPTQADPHLVLDADALGMISLGGIRPSLLARAGRIHAPEPAAPAFADLMFAADREPAAYTWF